jgi:hypothetical protein
LLVDDLGEFGGWVYVCMDGQMVGCKTWFKGLLHLVHQTSVQARSCHRFYLWDIHNLAQIVYFLSFGLKMVNIFFWNTFLGRFACILSRYNLFFESPAWSDKTIESLKCTWCLFHFNIWSARHLIRSKNKCISKILASNQLDIWVWQDIIKTVRFCIVYG